MMGWLRPTAHQQTNMHRSRTVSGIESPTRVPCGCYSYCTATSRHALKFGLAGSSQLAGVNPPTSQRPFAPLPRQMARDRARPRGRASSVAQVHSLRAINPAVALDWRLNPTTDSTQIRSKGHDSIRLRFATVVLEIMAPANWTPPQNKAPNNW